SHQAELAIIGLGYVGLPLATAFARAGFYVVGIDVDEARVEAVNRGQSYIQDVPSEVLAQLVRQAKGLVATSDYAALAACDVIFICVPTPFDDHKTPDLSYIVAAGQGIAGHLRAGHLVVLQSTTYPGTTEEVVQPVLEQSGLRAGVDFHLAFSPERVDPGNTRWTVDNTPKVVGGLTPACTELAATLLEQINPQVHRVSSPGVAEMCKLLENTFRSVNIALVNELALLAERLGLDVWEVIEAAATKPFGFMPFYPGPGVGGHCIPVDPYFLSWKAREYDFHTRFIELAAETNQRMPYHIVELIARALGERGRGLRGAKVLALGAAFKPDIDDARNAPSERVMQLLLARGTEVTYHDPYVPRLEFRASAFYGGEQVLYSTPLDEALLRAQDCVAILVSHRSLDYGWIAEHSPLVVDTVNATRGLPDPHHKIVRLGVGVWPG
ncbi:MAG: nucleotide sugar dehydrogenase, partial [Anaerolineae bacterium]